MKKIKKFLPLIFLGLSAIIAWSMGIHHVFSFESLKTHYVDLTQYVENHRGLAILIFWGLYCLCVSLSLPVATFLTLLAGVLFGQVLGTLAVVTAATAGASILFLSARLASKDFLLKKTGGFVQKMQAGFKENALSYLLTLRLIPLFPFVVVNLAAVLFGVPLSTFVFSTFLGIIPGSFVYVSMGVALGEVIQQPDFTPNIVLQPKILIALIGLGVFSLLPVIYKAFKRRQS